MIYFKDRLTNIMYVAYTSDFLKFVEEYNSTTKDLDLVKLELPVKINLASSWVDLKLNIRADQIARFNILNEKAEPVDLVEYIQNQKNQKAVTFIDKLLNEDSNYDKETYPDVDSMIKENPIQFRETFKEGF